MKQIIKNQYLKEFRFTSSEEAKIFYNRQKSQKKVIIENTFGENYYCYVCYHSLTREELFVILFSSDEQDLSLLFWGSLIVLETSTNIYLIDENLSVKLSFDITTPLIGLYLINRDRLLILEEAYMRIVDAQGNILKSELFDLIKDFSIKDNLLIIQTQEQSMVLELT